ncbi:hypothetical protein VNI00_015003 [Paramarasmius palmivorus]|uniref:NACHT domain-containing protein n=1 Tax=Paramarasmius palmivorus TaxID=297713 RepID=A0AAW0BND8_9AGAR
MGTNSGILSFQLYRHHRFWINKLLASVGIPVGEFDLAEVRKEMVHHQEKYAKYRLELVVKTENPALLPDPPTDPPIADSQTEGYTPRIIDDNSQRRVLEGDDLTTSCIDTHTECGPTGLTVHDDLRQRVAEQDDKSQSIEDRMERLKRKTEKHQRVYQTMDDIIAVLNDLSEVHEIARAASIVVSGIYQIITARHKQNKDIVALYDAMVATYKIAVEKDALNEEGDFSELFDEIVWQSEECYVFLSNYMVKGRLSQVMDFWDTSSKIADFNCAFEGLQRRFVSNQVEVMAVTLLNMQKVVASIAREQKLRPHQSFSQLLGPKSHCLLGTRRSSLSKILDWCFYGQQSVLWISGIAGCGKSSLIGTLHNVLSTFGYRSRLAAFIRFDRSSYNDAGAFVKDLAMLLASFDERFGKPITEVIDRSPQISQNTELQTQVTKLLINPLRGLGNDSEIAKEGRIVILADGIDECSRKDRAETNFREQLLELFRRNTFQSLPFLRFVLASRPEEDIVRYLRDRPHIHHFPLDHTSSETKSDILYFLVRSFQRPAFETLDDTQKRTAVERLAEHASGLFIWVAIVVKFIEENVEKRLKLFMKNDPPKDALHALEVLYNTALESLVTEGDNDIRQDICIALGFIMASSALSSWVKIPFQALHALPEYVDPENGTGVTGIFRKLQSLVTIEDGTYRLLHKSFDDFLSSESRAGGWYIDTEHYIAILPDTMIACTIGHLDKADNDLQKALSSDLYRFVISVPVQGLYHRNLSSFQQPDFQQKLVKFLLGYLIRWIRSFDTDLSGIGRGDDPRRFGIQCAVKAEENRGDSGVTQKAWLGASRLQSLSVDNIRVEDFLHIMLYDAARDGKVTETNAEGQREWQVDNIYMHVLIEMAGGSHIYEDILATLETNHIPPVVRLGPETVEIPKKIVSQGRIWMKSGFITDGDEKSTTEPIVWCREKRSELISARTEPPPSGDQNSTMDSLTKANQKPSLPLKENLTLRSAESSEENGGEKSTGSSTDANRKPRIMFIAPLKEKDFILWNANPPKKNVDGNSAAGSSMDATQEPTSKSIVPLREKDFTLWSIDSSKYVKQKPATESTRRLKVEHFTLWSAESQNGHGVSWRSLFPS